MVSPRPFTVIAGFLGTGKTTLVNRVLAEGQGTRYAVLVNDFGAVNVDAGLIADHDGQTMALTNGCICCSMSDGFTQTMLHLMSQPDAFDHVIVEASGVAEPGKIMDFARLDPDLSPDAIVTLADAETLLDRLSDRRVGEIAARQVEQADLICLTRTDLATDAQTVEADTSLARLNPAAPRLSGRAADHPLAALLGTGLAPGQVALPDPVSMTLHTITLGPIAPISRAAFDAWADGLGPDVLRGKGVIEITGEGPRLWQKVGARSDLAPAPDGVASGHLVLIGMSALAVESPDAPTS